jgi:hypothetical protein
VAPGSEFLLWSGAFVVKVPNLHLRTDIRLHGSGFPPPPLAEVGLAGIIPQLNVTHYLVTSNGTAHIIIPAPSAPAPLALLAPARRRR